MDHVDFCRALYRRLDSEAAEIADKVLNGSSQTLESYREQVGVLRGLRRARDTVHEMLDADERLDISQRP